MAWQQVFLDDFNRPDSTTVGNEWTQSTPSATPSAYGVVSNTLLFQRGGFAVWGLWRSTSAGYTRAVQCQLAQQLRGQLYVDVARRDSTDLNDLANGYGYMIQVVNNGNITLRRADNTGMSTSVGSASDVPVTAGTYYRLEHTQEGQLTFMSSQDGTTWTTHVTATDTTYMTAVDTNTYGVGAILYTSTTYNTSALDDFRVFELQDAPSGYTVDISAGSGGSVSTAQLTEVDNTTGKTFTATPNAGYRIASITPSTGITVTPAASGQTSATTFTVKATQAGSVLVGFEVVPAVYKPRRQRMMNLGGF